MLVQDGGKFLKNLIPKSVYIENHTVSINFIIFSKYLQKKCDEILNVYKTFIKILIIFYSYQDMTVEIHTELFYAFHLLYT